MRGAAKNKVVTSGRLSGKVKFQAARKRSSPNPGLAACPEPAYSLCSTESEDQVTSLHKGLDRCAALLSGILQTEKSEELQSPNRGVKGTAAKSKPSASLGKKTIKKPSRQTDKRSQSVQRGAGSSTPRTRQQFAAPAAHLGVKLHPPQKQSPAPPSHCHTPQHLNSSAACAGWPTESRSASETPRTCPKAERDREAEEFVPVKDVSTHRTVADSLIDTCTFKVSNVQRAHVDGHEETQHNAEREEKVKTAQYLLGELRALIAGEGSVAERLLSHLEQTVSLPPLNVGSSNTQTEADLSSLQSQNTQLRRQVRVLQQQLKEKENLNTLCAPAVSALQEELTAAQVRLRELQDDLTELRKALLDTQSQLSDREAKSERIASDLEATRSRLLDSEREKTKLASLAQQRLEELGHVTRSARVALESYSSSDCSTFVDQREQGSAEAVTDHIAHYLMSLAQPEPTATNRVCVAAERDGDEQNNQTSVQPSDTSSHAHVRAPRGSKLAESLSSQSCEQLSNSMLSRCDVESVWSDWSMRSGSTFDTRDEAAFRDGLSALDASIASLQKTLQLDLGR